MSKPQAKGRTCWHTNPLYPSLPISHYRWSLEYPRFAVNARDHQNQHSTQQLPPVLPIDLCSILPRDFISSLEQQPVRLKQKFSGVQVEKIDQLFLRSSKLRLLAFKEQDGFSQTLQNASTDSVVQSFEQCWSPLREFEDLHSFVGPSQALCQAQTELNRISLVWWWSTWSNWTKDPLSHSLPDFSLE